MRSLEDGREYQLGSMQGTNDQSLVFFQRTARNLTNREFHEQEAGESLPDYFFTSQDMDPEGDSGISSADPAHQVEKDGTSVDEVIKVLIAQYNHYQDTVPCSENEEAIECLQRIQELQLERNSNRRVTGKFATLKS